LHALKLLKIFFFNIPHIWGTSSHHPEDSSSADASSSCDIQEDRSHRGLHHRHPYRHGKMHHGRLPPNCLLSPANPPQSENIQLKTQLSIVRMTITTYL